MEENIQQKHFIKDVSHLTLFMKHTTSAGKTLIHSGILKDFDKHMIMIIDDKKGKTKILSTSDIGEINLVNTGQTNKELIKDIKGSENNASAE